MRILIVGVSNDFRQPIEKLLRKNGYNELQFVATAEEVCKLLGFDDEAGLIDDSARQLDLIIMNKNMRDGDGVEACRRIKATDGFVDVPVIMLTAKDDDAALEEAFGAGASDYICIPPRKCEFLARVRAALALKRETDRHRVASKRLDVLFTQLADANAKLKRQSLVDGLTGVENRRSFDYQLSRLHGMAVRDHTPLGLIFIDIDFFKLYNDTYGHLPGDECLKLVARSIKESLNRQGDIVARYGGEEFVVLLSGTDVKGALVTAERIRVNVVEKKLKHRASTVSKYVTISLGVASVLPARGSNIRDIVDMADKALYRAKEAGRNRVEKAS